MPTAADRHGAERHSGAAPEGVILAAGKGKRIQPFSHRVPKPLLPVLGKPLLAWQVEAMRALGVRRIHVVIGHLGHQIVQELGDGQRFGVEFRFVEQEHTLGIAHAVAQLEPSVDGPFLLFLGDIFFETRELHTMLELAAQPGVKAVLAVKHEDDEAALRRNFTVELGARGQVARVVEKPRRPRTQLKGCGLYWFEPAIFDAVRRTPRTALRDEYELTEAIQIMIDDGCEVLPAAVVERDLNLSTPGDLLDLNLHVLAKSGLPRFVADGAEIGQGAALERSVVLTGAAVAPRAVLQSCLVMPGERVAGGSYERTIFSQGQLIGC
jgi:dTDP-glucose pyrophosphorylase